MTRKKFGVALSVLAVTLLAGCSSNGGGGGIMFRAIKDTLFSGGDKETVQPAGTPSSGGLTRARIEESGLALIRANIDGDSATNVLSATSLNGGYVTYVSAFQQSISMKGTLITATRGLGSDLLSVADAPNDPIANMTPIANWAKSYERSYRFTGDGPAGRVITVQCALSSQAPMQVTIVEVTYDVTPFIESCRGDGVSFNNVHLADEDGQIWQSRQWVGEGLGILNIEVLEPLTP